MVGTPGGLTFVRSAIENWIGLGFSEAAISRFLQHGVLYFLSWSHNHEQPAVFVPGDVYLFSHDKMRLEPGWKPEKHPVTIDGPYSAGDMAGQFISYSPFENEQQVEQMVRIRRDEMGERMRFPLYMWRAVRR